MSIECADKERPRSDSGLESEKKAVEGRGERIRWRVRGFVRLFGFFGGAPLRIRNVARRSLSAALVVHFCCSLGIALLQTSTSPRAPLYNPPVPLSLPPLSCLCLHLSLSAWLFCAFLRIPLAAFGKVKGLRCPLSRTLSLSLSLSPSLTAFLLRFFCGHKMLPGPKNEIWAQVSHIAHRKR